MFRDFLVGDSSDFDDFREGFLGVFSRCIFTDLLRTDISRHLHSMSSVLIRAEMDEMQMIPSVFTEMHSLKRVFLNLDTKRTVLAFPGKSLSIIIF